MESDMTVTVMRCVHCRKGLDISNCLGKYCEYCGGGKWNTRAAPLTLRETIRLYRATNTLFYFEPSWWLGLLEYALRILEFVHLTGKNIEKGDNALRG